MTKKTVKTNNFPIVGIGASAGGLEAMEQFFHHLSGDSGMAFVLVSHLDPDHASILSEILQHTTSMPVVEAQDLMPVLPDHVYVIAPNRSMRIAHGILQLTNLEEPRGQRMLIDTFLCSLAEDRGKAAIGIVLSGTGADGTVGLGAILAAGGMTLVQEPTGARFDGMPISAIQAGYANYILPVEDMPKQLLSNSRVQEVPLAPSTIDGINRILMQLSGNMGNDFSLYKKNTIHRRILRRMAEHNIDDMDTYSRYLKAHPAEMALLFKELLINVTNFFRDPEAFVLLKQDILPQLFQAKPGDYVFRVWVPGCATGEEAYSIAMLLREFMDENHLDFKVQIYGTDLDHEAIAIARAGVYPPSIAQDMTPERLQGFFIKEEAGYRVKKEIREMVVFAVQNLIKDPPFTKLDLLSCRNLMIYLEPELQNRLIPVFHYALKPNGVLFISASESIGNHHDLFTPLCRKWKIYRASHSIASTHTVLGGSLPWVSDRARKMPEDVIKKAREINFADLTKRLLLQSYAPASVVTDLEGNILYVHGDIDKYLRQPAGQPTLNVVDMARGEHLQAQLRIALHNAETANDAALCRDLCIKSQGECQAVHLTVRLLPNLDATQKLLLVSFQEVLCAAGKSTQSHSGEGWRVEELERELAYTKEALQVHIEEQQLFNEELQTTNEELQSTNEELDTSTLELQFVNQELVTVNAELHTKIEQLVGMQNDMNNLLDNIRVGTIFLDQKLVIRRFTRDVTRIYRLIASDVGRLLSDIKSDLQHDELLAEAQSVLDTLVPCECEVATRQGDWFLLRIQPYRTLDNAIDGVVLTFTDISKRVESEAAVRLAQEKAEGIINTLREPLLVLDGTLQIVSASRSFYQHFQVSEENTVGLKIYDLGDGQWNIPALRELLETVLPRQQAFDDYVVEHDFPVIGHRKMLLNAREINVKVGELPLILLAIEVLV